VLAKIVGRRYLMAAAEMRSRFPLMNGSELPISCHLRIAFRLHDQDAAPCCAWDAKGSRTAEK
jgi:hypothetical protein